MITKEFERGTPFSAKAERLDAKNPYHLIRVAEIITMGGIVGFPFKGIFGFFGNMYDPQAAEAIIRAKGRSTDKRLIVVTTPEKIDTHSDLSKTRYPKEQLVALLTDIHALGVILPASPRAPYHLVGEGVGRTIVTIWTEYPPLRTMMEYLYILGGKGLVGTSANKSGDATHYDPDELWKEFSHAVQAVVFTRFDLPDCRLMSTSIVDLTNDRPTLHRRGNVSDEELRKVLNRHGFPDLWIPPDVPTVRRRIYDE